jgi:PAS domain S-box-containing protein
MSSEAHSRESSTGLVTLAEEAPDLYKEIFIHSNEAIAIINPRGYYLEQNASHRDLLGFSDEELQGRTPAIHMGEETFSEVAQELAEKGEFRGEVISRTKSGETRNIELSAFAMKNSAGIPLCYVGIKRDITERKRTEQRLILQYAVSGILSKSIDFVESTNKLLQTVGENLSWDLGALWRVDRREEVMRCVGVWHAPKVQVTEFEALSRGTAFVKGVGLPGRIWASGEPAWIPNVAEDTNFPRASVALKEDLHAAFGFPILVGREILGVVEFFSREIRQPDEELLKIVASIGAQIGQFQERKRAEEKLAWLLVRERAARAEAEQASRLKDEFLATVSHELRTPLNAVIGWARMLRSGRLDAESSTHALEVVDRNAWAQKQIIEDILDVSRVITGKLQLNFYPVDLVPVVDGALDAVRPALEAKEIHISRTINSDIGLISGDANRLQQVVWNLLSNAAKFTPNGGQVEIRVGRANGQVQIEVSDSGPGIVPEFLPYVFERFRQADGSTTRTHGGLGLGLAIVRHLVELHGGIITARNRTEGHGAIFTVNLPVPTGELRLDALKSAAAAFKGSEPEEEARPSLEGTEILVVDDETDTLDLMSMELTACGAKVTAVTSAADALAAFEKSGFDLIISDIGMPDADGYELIRKFRLRESGQPKRTPAVALTAYARVQDRMRAYIAGYDTHVAKPIETNELLTVVASLVGRLGEK